MTDLSELEVKLREETARRAVILDERAKAADAVARGDQKARVLQSQLNKEDIAAGRLIRSLTNQITAARKRAEVAANKAAQLDKAGPGVKLMSGLEAAQITLATVEGRLAAALGKRDKIAQETARVNAEAAAAHRYSPALAPLNKSAKLLDGEIAVARIELRHARQALDIQEAAATNVREQKELAANGGPPRRDVQLEIRAPDGRTLRQFHKSVESARRALQPGYEITGEVISGTIVSPIGRPFMKALLESEGDVLMEFLEARGIVGNPVKITLPSNGREKMQ
jgi:hypothetical protein